MSERIFARTAALVALLCVILLCAMVNAAENPKPKTAAPEVIFIHGDIYLGATFFFFRESENGIGPMGGSPSVSILLERSGTASPLGRAEALAVRGGRVLATGSSVELLKLKDGKTKVIDLGGHFAIPGFNDAHVHLWSGGLEMQRVDLVGVKSLDEMKQRIAAAAKKSAPGDWLLGRGWDHTAWPGQALPARADLDAVTGEHPALFVRVDGHICVANSAALKFAAMDRNTPDPPGGKIDRDSQGEPTGILREAAKEMLQARVPRPTPAQRRRAIELGLAEAARWGVTSIQESPVNTDDATEWEYFLVYEQLERVGKLTARVSEWLPFDAPLEVLKQHRASHPHDDLMLRTGMLKGYMDGSLGSRTAALLAPYSDDPGNSGITRYEQAKLDQMTRERVAAGFQIGFHAIGDRAAEVALKAFADAAKSAPAGAQNVRFRIEHDQVLAPPQFREYARLGVIASVQPNHLLTDMNWAEARLGAARARISYPWRTFLKSGVTLAFGTDYPVEPITPFRGIYAAITRQNEAGSKSYYPEQKLDVDQAIAAYTSGAAYAEFAEKDKGTLAPGMLADMVVLDRDITKVPPAEILKTRVLRTVVGGKSVYEGRP